MIHVRLSSGLHAGVVLGSLLALSSCAFEGGLFRNLDVGPQRVHRVSVQSTEVSGLSSHVGGDAMSLEVGFGAGTIDVGPGDQAEQVSLEVHTNIDGREPLVRDEWRGDRRHLALETPDQQIGLFDLFNLDEVEHAWDLRLARHVPFDLELSIGAGEGHIELGGLSVRQAVVEFGAAEATLGWSEPNGCRLEHLSLEAGAAAVRVRGLGHAGLHQAEFDLAAGDYTLDFDGEWPEPARVTIDAGVGNVTLRIPDDLPVRLTTDLSLAGFDCALDRAGDAWTSSVREGETGWVEISVSLSVGQLTVERLDSYEFEERHHSE